MAAARHEPSVPPPDVDDSRGAARQFSDEVELPPPSGPDWTEMTLLPNEVPRQGDVEADLHSGCDDRGEAITTSPLCDLCKDNTKSGLLPTRKYETEIYDLKEIPRSVRSFGNKVLSEPRKTNPYQSKRRFSFGRILAGSMYPPIVACVFVLVGYCAIRRSHVEDEKDPTVTLVPIVLTILAICYAVVLLEFCLCETSQYVCRGTDQRGAGAYTHALRHAEPRLLLRLSKYRKSPFWSEENPSYVRRAKRELEVTITRWKDFTPELDMTSSFRDDHVVKLRVRTVVCFMDEATSQEYQRQRSILEEEAQEEEEDLTFIKTYLKMPGYHERLMVTRHRAVAVLLRVIYVLCGLLLLGWVFRRYFKNHTAHAHHRIMKIVGI